MLKRYSFYTCASIAFCDINISDRQFLIFDKRMESLWLWDKNIEWLWVNLRLVAWGGNSATQIWRNALSGVRRSHRWALSVKR